MKQTATDYDVVVVGAGPSGSTTAYLLAKWGYRVCVVDKAHFPRPKLCAGVLTWKSVDLLQRIFGCSRDHLLKNGIFAHTCRNYRIYIDSQVITERRLNFPFHFVERLDYDHFWLQKARQAGCHLSLGKSVTHVDPINGKIDIAGGSRIKAGIIIGADGIWSKVRQSLMETKADYSKWRHGMATTIETWHAVEHSKELDSHAAIYFGHLPWGYAWIFPGKGRRVVGIGGLVHKSNHSMARHFHQFLAANHIDAAQLSPWQSHPLPYGNHMVEPAQGRVLLVGDACGLADPLLGEGIYYAHRSGELAAHAIMDADADARGAAAGYKRALNSQILTELRWIKFYRNLLFVGGRHRQFRGLKLFFRWMPARLESALQGQLLFSELVNPFHKSPRAISA